MKLLEFLLIKEILLQLGAWPVPITTSENIAAGSNLEASGLHCLRAGPQTFEREEGRQGTTSLTI